MWTRKELKEKAKAAVHRNYWKSVGFALLMGVLTGGSLSSSGSGSRSVEELGNASEGLSPEVIAAIILAVIGIVAVIGTISLVIELLVKNPIEIGYCKFMEDGIKDSGSLDCIAYGFKNGYKRNICILFMRKIFIFLWTLLFFIPGVIKAYEYRMVPFIAAENPEMSSKEVFQRSKELMTGNKWKAFVLDWSFIGWDILVIFTCGILSIFWVKPYQDFTNAALYEALKEQQ